MAFSPSWGSKSVGLELKLDLAEVDRAFGNVTIASAHLRDVFARLESPVRRQHNRQARNMSGPDGKWPARATATMERRRTNSKFNRLRTRLVKAGMIPKAVRRRARPKNLLGRIPRALRVEAGDRFLRITSAIPWASVHQFGGRVGRGGKVRLPARPFLWISEEMKHIVVERLALHLFKAWKRTQ